jgi:hypothetical protein
VGEGYALDRSGFYVLFEAEGHSALSAQRDIDDVGVVRDVEGFVAVFADIVGAASVVLDEDVV